MKVLLVLLCLIAFISARPSEEVPALPNFEPADNGVAEAVEVVGGILVGAFTHHTSIKQCFDGSKDVFTHFSAAYSNLRKETHSGVESGLIEIGKALSKIPDTIKSCKDVGNIMTKLRSLAVMFSNPTLLTVNAGKNIIWHFRSIYKEIKSVVGAYEHRNWFSMGMSIGVIIDLVFLSNPRFAKLFGNPAIDFLDGFAHGLDPAVYDDAKQCITDVSPEVVQTIIDKINDLDWKNVERSIEDIQDLINIFVGIVKDCQSGSQAFTEFVERLLNALNAFNFIEAALEFITNPLKFYRMIKQIKEDVDKDDWFDAGDITGDFVGDVLHLHLSPTLQAIKVSE